MGEYQNDKDLWETLDKGGITNYIMGMKDYNLGLSQKITESWDGGKVMVSCVSFVIMLESISIITRLRMEGDKILRNAKISFKDSLEHLAG